MYISTNIYIYRTIITIIFMYIYIYKYIYIYGYRYLYRYRYYIILYYIIYILYYINYDIWNTIKILCIIGYRMISYTGYSVTLFIQVHTVWSIFPSGFQQLSV